LEHSLLEAAGAKCSRFEGVRFSACTRRHMQIMLNERTTRHPQNAGMVEMPGQPVQVL